MKIFLTLSTIAIGILSFHLSAEVVPYKFTPHSLKRKSHLSDTTYIKGNYIYTRKDGVMKVKSK